MRIKNTEIFKLHAEFCKTLANPTRLMILALLKEKEMSVGEIAEIINIRIANISQNLTSLRLKHIVKSRKEGQTVFYSLTDPRLMDACTIIRSVLLESMKRRGLIAEDFDAEEVVVDD